MARSGPALLAAATACLVACTYTFNVPDDAQISCSDGGVPCPDGWHCEVARGRCAKNGSVVEVPEIRVPTATISTSEDGGAASLAVTLGATPTAPVRVPVVSTLLSEATVFPPELAFDDTNWNQPQTVTVVGVRDQVVDGDQAYEVVVGPPISTDGRYSALQAIRIPGTNADFDTAEIRASPNSITTSESDTPATATPVQVTLSSRPNGVVIVPVASSDTTEATVTPDSLAFDAGTWNVPQTIRVVGVDDPFPIADGRHPFQVLLGPATSAADGHFKGVTATVDGFNVDNDSPGVRIQSSTGLYTYEPNSSAYAYVSLFTQPTSDVTISFTSLNTDQVTVDPTTAVLTFDAGNWNQEQYVVINPVDDPYDEIPQYAPWTVLSGNAVSTDPNYSGLTVDDITGFNTDDEVAGLLFDGSQFGNYTTFENAGPKQIQVTLSSKPHGQVTIRPASADTSRLVVAPAQITLDTNTWSTGAVMTVTPVDDNIRQYDQSVEITFSVTAALPTQDPGYQNPMVNSLSVYIQDDERIIFTTSTTVAGELSDLGGGTYYVVDSYCYTDPGQSQLFNTAYALVAIDNAPYNLQRIASVTPNLGDGQNWILSAGKNYIADTKTGPVIGRANAKGFFDFPLSHPLTTAGDVWTGLETDWTTSSTNCGNWEDNISNLVGRTGASGSTTATALVGGTATCDSPRHLLCVEQ
jgi:uncharacterized protein DUF1554